MSLFLPCSLGDAYGGDRWTRPELAEERASFRPIWGDLW